MSDDLDGFDPRFERRFALAMSEASAQPLTTAQLTAVVTDPRWDAVVAALVALGAARSAGGPAVPAPPSGAAAVRSALAGAVATAGGTGPATAGAPVPGAPAR